MTTPLRLSESPPEPPPASTRLAMSPQTIALTVIAAAAATAILRWAQAVFIPIVLSILISYAMEPVVAFLVRLRLHRMIASVLVVLLTVSALGYTGYSLSDDATAIVARLPEAAQTLRRSLRRTAGDPGAIEHVQKAAEELQKTADAATGRNPAPSGVTRVQIEQPAIDVRQYLYWGSTGAMAFAGQAVLVTFFVFFLLASGDLYKRKIVKLAGPSLVKKRVTVQILDEINLQIERFLLVRLVTSLGVGVATWLAFRLIGLENPAVWGVAAGVFDSIPYFGPVIVAGGTFVVALLQFGTLPMAVYVSAISLAITSLEGWILTPWLTSRTAQSNEVAIFVALIFWGWVWGVWGTLLAVPMLVVVKAYCDRIDDFKPVGELLGR